MNKKPVKTVVGPPNWTGLMPLPSSSPDRDALVSVVQAIEAAFPGQDYLFAVKGSEDFLLQSSSGPVEQDTLDFLLTKGTLEVPVVRFYNIERDDMEVLTQKAWEDFQAGFARLSQFRMAVRDLSIAFHQDATGGSTDGH
jgi:hypothetical protein